MSESVTLLAAFGGGLISFLSPCVLPIVPAYLSVITGLDIGEIRLADHAGRPVVVNFFASWCTACDAELPGFSTLSRRLEGQITFIGVNALETGDPMDMPRRHNITWWPLASDIQGRGGGSGLHAALGGRGMPITAFYDDDGRRLHDLYDADT